MKFILPLFILALTSCSKPIIFEKVFVNNTDQTITVTDKCSSSIQEVHEIAPRTTETLMLCGWSRIGARPSLEDVENRYQIVSERPVLKKIENHKNGLSTMRKTT